MPPDDPIEANELSVEGVVDLLNSDDKADETTIIEDGSKDIKEREGRETKAQYDEEDEDEEDKKSKEEDEEDDEEDDDEEELQLIAPYRKQEILKAYPGLDKKFPFLFHAYYGYQKYTDLLPSVEDAEEAVEKAKALDRVYGEIMTGRTETVIQEIKKNPKAFYKLIDDYIPALARVDKDAATHVISGVYKNAIASMINFARENQNEELEKAAGILHQFLFSTNRFVPHQRLSKETSEREENTVSEERMRFNEERFSTVQKDMIDKMDSAIMSTIKLNIDRDKQMTPYVRNKASKDAFDLLERNLLADKMFRGQIDRLWRAAFQDDLSRNSLERIRKAFLSRATTLLPGVLKHSRNEALKGLGRKTSSDDRDRRGPLPVGRNSSSGETKSRGERRAAIPDGMSVRDFIMQD